MAGPARALPADPATRRALEASRLMLDGERIGEAVQFLTQLEALNPAVAEIHLLLGRAYLKAREYPASLKEFRWALQLDPDYADPKTRKFAGDAIQGAIIEGIRHSRAELIRIPGSPMAKTALKDARYLERMLAGGCG